MALPSCQGVSGSIGNTQPGRMIALVSIASLLMPLASDSTNVVPAVEPLRLEGLITAVMTPYDSEGGLNLTVVPALAAYLRKTGVKGVFVGGTTGDSLSLTLAERKALTQAWALQAALNNLTMIVHVGAEALGDATELARHAAEFGVSALGAMPSVFFKPATEQALALWLKRIGAAAPSLPLYYYHIPSMTGVTFHMLDLIQAVEAVGVPQFAGVKFTGLYEPQCWMDFERCRAYKEGRYDVYCGREEMTMQALSVGTKGFIGSQFNFAADVYRHIAAAWPNTSRALRVQALAQDLLTSWSAAVPPGVDGGRMVLHYAGVPIGPPRLPNLPPDTATVKKMSDNLDKWCRVASGVLNELPVLCWSRAAAQKSQEHVV